MAGKTKTQSKTARASTKAGRSNQARDLDNRDLAKLISLNGGQSAYVLHPRGKTQQMRTDSAQFRDIIGELVAGGIGTRIHEEIASFAARWPSSAWPAVCSNLEADKAFEVADDTES